MSQPITHYYVAASHKTFLLEDQIIGPCSVEGYRRALLSGCRYIEIEVYDGYDGYPVVRRANSRPSGIPAEAVLEMISALAFQRSDYPLIISIECFASATQQLILANLLLSCFASRLLMPSAEFLFNLSDTQLEAEEHTGRFRDAYRKHSVTTVDLRNEASLYTSDGAHVRWPSPRDLIGRILLKGKRLPKGSIINASDAYPNGRNPSSRLVSRYMANIQSNAIIKELSDLFFFDSAACASIPTVYETKGFPYRKITPAKISTKFDQPQLGLLSPGQDRSRVHPYHFVQITESEASKAMGHAAGELVQYTRNFLFEVIPSPSRADSSNLNPIDVWAWGGQVVPLNYQTAGLVMDLATGFFARNGACGYVLKPFLYRNVSSFFTPAAEYVVGSQLWTPDTLPQIFRLKILSAQQLPKPRGSVSKGDTIEPYVVVEIHGIPIDCAEQRTSTAVAGNASGYNAIFNDTFEFCVQLGSLALVRFVVLDDHAIGDDFIGQNTIPFDCLLSGYRHVRLRSDTGEPIPQATLFVHITISCRTEDGAQTATLTLHQAIELRSSLLTAFDQFRQYCGETSSTMSMAQCIRALASRLNTACGSPEAWPVRMRIRHEDDLPHLELQASSPLFGSNVSVFPGSSSLGESSSQRSSSSRFSPSPGLHRSPSVILSTRSFFQRRMRRDSRSIDEETSSSLSIEVTALSTPAGATDKPREVSPLSIPPPRRSSIQSNSSSVSSLSVGGFDKMRRTISGFETFIETAKTVIKQGPYLRVKLQHAQRTALEAYTAFLENLKDPKGTNSHVSSTAFVSNEDAQQEPDMGSVRRLHVSTTIGRHQGSTRTEQGSEEHRATTGSGRVLYWRKMSRIADNVTWNLRLLIGQADQLTNTLSELNSWLRQAREAGSATGLLITSSKEVMNDIGDKSDSTSLLSDTVQEPVKDDGVAPSNVSTDPSYCAYDSSLRQSRSPNCRATGVNSSPGSCQSTGPLNPVKPNDSASIQTKPSRQLTSCLKSTRATNPPKTLASTTHGMPAEHNCQTNSTPLNSNSDVPHLSSRLRRTSDRSSTKST
ncbi:inactive phospholipase C-like protein 2 [Paragonimus westermani]|uniref:Phosphoinositide phospholipase C n=1 Tax=Paragonimus westermani TaxID=34504 RepID=A0A5J4NTX2_9TREM|nr:inactive phospholipase C-like protein 2 [Paragonimus westermani]